jgi:hypothetical protein
MHKASFLVMILIGIAGLKSNGQDVHQTHGYVLKFNEDDLESYREVRKTDTTFNLASASKVVKKDLVTHNTAIYLTTPRSDNTIDVRLEVFDKKNNLVFTRVEMKGIPIEKYSYLYDTQGRVIERAGYSSGDSGSTLTISYK